ncbi:CBS domain-containing protein [Acidianus manzaensis]|uniref:CBS domain-containing protein n=1 Tax=Acidianus manzaensis TaxID=282676 RepID=A0A1W6JXM1_9CREN|nr:CBS domain-containing protein [Acidianus manzaensis]ARM75013.1 CBS domain-containing protein [Acidianus manzaensis]
MSYKVSQIATKKVLVTKPSEKIIDAAKLMKENNLGSLVIVDSQYKLIGIITERDIVKAAANNDLESEIEKYMTKEVKGVLVDTPVTDALNIMLENGFRHLPIITKDGKLYGIVSIRDLSRAILDVHYMQFGKSADEVKGTGIVCPVCGMEIDEYGYCGCGTGSG